MFWTYVIQSISIGKVYTGHTGNLEDRLKRHIEGRSKATKGWAPLLLIAAIERETKSDAYQLELKLKRMKNPEKMFRYLEIHFPESIKNKLV